MSIEISNINKRFGQFQALNAINLHIQRDAPGRQHADLANGVQRQVSSAHGERVAHRQHFATGRGRHRLAPGDVVFCVCKSHDSIS